MTDTVTRLMNMSREIEEIAALCADPMNSEDELDEYRTDLYKARQALEAELTRLFTPLSDGQIDMVFKNQLGYFIVPTQDDTAFARAVEKAHGIGGES